MVVKPDARNEPIPFGFTQSSRLIFVLLGATILLGALVAPWWTRGLDIDEEQLYETDEDGEADADLSYLLLLGIGPGSEGRYYNYGAFSTPTANGMSTDSAREPAVAILGVGLALCAVFAVASVVVRWMMARGTLEVSYDAPVRLAIVAFIAGTFAVLWGAFFLPLAGDNPGMLYGEEPTEDAYQITEGVFETVRYANVGFFLGIAGAVLFPAYLWFDAARVRALHALGWGTDQTVATTA